MRDDKRRCHFVRPNETTRVPRKLIFLDTESTKERSPFGHTQRWALAVTCFREQRPDRRSRERWSTWDDPELLWQEVDAYCGKSGRTVLWAHNLGYDTRIAEMLHILPAMGWVLVAHNLSPRGTWLMWRRGRAALTMVDSASVFPCTLARLGTYEGLPKLRLPEASTGGVGLYSRCWRDVEILRRAVLDYLRWIEDEDLGNWQLTGAGQSWAAFRHRFMDSPLLVHDDSVALQAERRAMWTGRCEAYWVGRLEFEVVHEWDLSLAYARIAKDTHVPVRLLGPMPSEYDWAARLVSVGTALLAECTVTTGLPVVPCAHGGRIAWPVGTFTTTLWDVEIRAAIDAGATITVHRGWLYRTAPALRAWAEWVCGQLDTLRDMTDHWKYIVLKHWARALIGRFAMTYTKWEEFATAPTPSVRAHDVYDASTGETYRTVQIGQTMWRDVGTRESGESIPAITGYVQAVGRVRLWTILRECPPRSALYADTDSVLVPDAHSPAMATIAQAHPEWGLRLKRSWQGFTIWGPRQIRTGDVVRISGVSRDATQVERHRFEGEVWQSLQGAVQGSTADQVVITRRAWTIRCEDHRRVSPGFGWTRPIELGVQEHDQPDPGRRNPGRHRDGRGDHHTGRPDRQRRRDDGRATPTSLGAGGRLAPSEQPVPPGPERPAHGVSEPRPVRSGVTPYSTRNTTPAGRE